MPDIPELSTRAAVLPATFNAEKRTVEVQWSSGATVRRFDFWDGPYLEELVLTPEAVRMERMNAGAPVLRDHTATIANVIGVVERAWLEGGTGRALIRFSEREEVVPILADLKDGILRNLSVGYAVHQYEVDRPKEKDAIPTFRAVDWEPMEISLVGIPADATAQVRTHPVALTQRINKMSDPNETPETPEVPPAAPPPEQQEPEVAIQRAIQLERQRVAGIREAARAAKLEESMVDTLIQSGQPLDVCRTEIIKAWSAKVDATATPSRFEAGEDSKDKFLRGAAEALLTRMGVETVDLTGNEFRGLRLPDLARMSLERAGHKTAGMSYDAMANLVLRTQTTSDFSVLLENTMHKTLLNAYSTAPDVWRQICRVGSVSDFRDWKRLQTGTLANLTQVNEAGELTNMPISDATAESIHAVRYGNVISITPEVLINDDLDWIGNQSQALGRSAARTVEARVFAVLLANANMADGNALFSAAHANIQTAGGTVSVATVDAGRVAMASQMDKDSHDYLNIVPSILLVPIAIGGLSRVTTQSQYDPDAAARLLVPNKINGLISTVIDTPRITTGWYLFANPSAAPVLEVVFLDGNQSPRIQQEESFRTKGLSWSVELPFGVGVVDYRGAYFNDGSP